MIKNTLIIIATALTFCTAPAMAQTTIERLAPEGTVLIIGAKNVQNVKAQLERTSLWALWESDQIKKMRADAIKSMTEDMDKMFQELGVDKESLVCPTGAMGFALFTARDPDTDMPVPAFIGLADYGTAENAEKTDTLVQAALKRGEDEGEIEFDHKDIAGRTVYTIDLSKMRDKAAADMDDDEMDFNMMPMPDPSEMLDGISKLHYVREGAAIMLSSDIRALTEAIETADGKARAGGLTDRAEFQSVMAKIGDSDVYGVLLTHDVMDLFAASDPMGMAQMMKPMIRSLFGEVQGYGFGMKIDGSTAMIEQTMFAYMPNGKRGLTKLIDQPAARADAPAFVGADTISYSTIAFDFSGLMEVVRTVAMSNPMLAGQAGPQLDAIAPMVNQITATLGKRVHMMQAATRPFTVANQQSLVAIECTKPQEFEDLFSGMAAQMGLEARDFLGQRIYAIDPNMMAMMMPMPMEIKPSSIGIGGGFILIGPTTAVEQGLRATAQPGGAALATVPDFQRAVAALSKDATVAWGYTHTIDSMEASLAVQREMIETMIQDMREDGGMAGEDGEGFDEFDAEFEEQLRGSLKMWDAFDFPFLRKYIGAGSWQITSSDDGFTMRAFLLNADGK